MTQETALKILTPSQRSRWHSVAPDIWSLRGADVESQPVRTILTTLWDQPRWLEAYLLYDERGSELFEEICRLPEYYLTRTENAILQTHAGRIIEAAPVSCVVELGAGYAKKTIHLLSEQLRRRGRSIFVPIDVSLAGLLACREAAQRDFPHLEFHGLRARYEDGFTAVDKALPSLFVFLGSSIGNFNLTEFPRFLQALSQAMGPNDFLLLGADRIKAVEILENAYNDSRGVTAQFILNVFCHMNRQLKSNFDLSRMRYEMCYDAEWRQIEMYAVATEEQEIVFPTANTGFRWKKDEKILVEISRKFDPARLQEQLRFFDLESVDHFTDEKEWFSLLLFKKI